MSSKFSSLSLKEALQPASIGSTMSNVSTTSTHSSTRKVDQTICKTTTSTCEEGMQEDWAMPGFLGLKELNSLLLKYIGQVQDLELNQNKGAGTSITVNIDRYEPSCTMHHACS